LIPASPHPPLYIYISPSSPKKLPPLLSPPRQWRLLNRRISFASRTLTPSPSLSLASLEKNYVIKKGNFLFSLSTSWAWRNRNWRPGRRICRGGRRK
uniref:Uncharacterized protein n=1 Tax=Oryza brachyantha TaxID=4533 RepID=J3L6U7_ORYBR